MRIRETVALASVFGLLVGTSGASAQAVSNSGPIDEQGFVTIGGIEQWVTIHGNDRSNPVILVLHGGPGVSNAPFAPAYIPWQTGFTVVEWDQRGAGRTFGRNGADGSGPLTLDRLRRDGLELSEHLRAELHKDKIVLFGEIGRAHV